MTSPRRGRFDTIIQGLLDNVQRGNENIQRRFEVAEERDFVRERDEDAREFDREVYRRTREDTVEDRELAYARSREAEGRILREQLSSEFQALLGFMPEGYESRDDVLEIIRQLSEDPIGLSGEEYYQAMLRARGSLTLPDGRNVNPSQYLAELEENRRLIQLQENWTDNWIAQQLKIIGDPSEDAGYRSSLATSLIRNSNVPLHIKQEALNIAGIFDPREQQRYINEQLAVNIDIARANLDLQIAGFTFQQMQLLAPLEYEAAQEQLNQMRAQAGRDAIGFFLETGGLPESQRERDHIARSFFGGNHLAMEQAGRATFLRWKRQQQNAATLSDMSVTLTSQQISANDIANRTSEYRLQHDQMWQNLEKGLEVADWALAAANNGDVAALQQLRDMYEMGMYQEQLAGLKFDSLIERAELFQADITETLESKQAARYAANIESVTTGMVTMQAFNEAVGSTFDDDAYFGEYDAATDTYPALEAAVDEYMKSVSSTNLELVGTTREQMRADLIKEARRARVTKERSEAMQMMARMEAAIPPASDTAARQAWRVNYLALAAEAGLDPESFEPLISGMFSGADAELNKLVAEARRLNQEADYTYQATVGQYLDNYFTIVAAGGAGETQVLTMEDYEFMRDQLKTELDGWLSVANQNACGLTAVGAEINSSGELGVPYNSANPLCSEAHQNASRVARQLQDLNTMAVFGRPPGSVTLDGSRLSGGADGPQALRASGSAEIVANLDRHNFVGAEFDAERYDLIQNEAVRNEIGVLANNGSSPAELNALVEAALLQVSIAAGAVGIPSQVPTAEEQGLDLGARHMLSPEWQAIPVAERGEILANVREFHEDAATIVREYGSLEDMPTVAASHLANKYGFGASNNAWPVPQWVADVEAFATAMAPIVDEVRANAIRLAEGELRRSGAESMDGSEGGPAAFPYGGMGVNTGASAMGQAFVGTGIVGDIPGLATAEGTGSTSMQLTGGGLLGALTGQGAVPAAPIDAAAPPASTGLTGWPATTLNNIDPVVVEMANSIMGALLIQESGGRNRQADGSITAGPGVERLAGVSALGLAQIIPSTAANPGYGLAPLVPGYSGLYEAMAQSDPEEYQRLSALVAAEMENVPIERAVQFGRDYFAAMISSYHGDIAKALASYNWGPGNLGQSIARNNLAGTPHLWLADAPDQTRNYVRNILTMVGQEHLIPPLYR